MYKKIKKPNLDSVFNSLGMVFIGPIVGLPDSLKDVFKDLQEDGLDIEWVDIWEKQSKKSGFWKILGLTFLPGSNKRRISFANNYNEGVLFKIIAQRIENLIKKGKNKIVIGGMSGGFIFASRITQSPLDKEVLSLAEKIKPSIMGLVGISPLVFYPPGVSRTGANLELIPKNIPTVLIWGDNDVIVPKETIPYCRKVAEHRNNIQCRVIEGSKVGRKNGTIKHQFFGGKDFVKPLKNIFWNQEAEQVAMGAVKDLILNINRKIVNQ